MRECAYCTGVGTIPRRSICASTSMCGASARAGANARIGASAGTGSMARIGTRPKNPHEYPFPREDHPRREY